MNKEKYCPDCKDYKTCNSEYKEDSGYCDDFKLVENIINFKNMNDEIKQYSQTNIDSLMIKAVKQVLGCDMNHAIHISSTLCNVNSFRNNLYYPGFIQLQFSDWYSWGLKTLFDGVPAWDETGWIKASDNQIVKFFNPQLEVVKFGSFEEITDAEDGQMYKVYILNKDNNSHFTTAYRDQGRFWVSDSTWRGNPSLIEKAFRTDKIQSVKRIQIQK